MRYWDSSAILPLLITESATPAMSTLMQEDAAIVTWWGTAVECMSALARLERDRMLDTAAVRAAVTRLDAARREWTEVAPVEDVRAQSLRLLRTHRLRAADALQLAAAVVAADFRAASLPFVTLDARLAEAAEREGFSVLS